MTDLERLAQALMSATGVDGLPILNLDPDFHDMPLTDDATDERDPFTQGEVLSLVRAVLTALREPSNAVLDAGADNLVGSVNDDWRGDALIVWRAMIDSILSETE